MDYKILKAELANDPAGLGYAGKGIQQCTDLLNALTQAVARASITGAELWENTTLAEYAALTQAQRDAYQVLVSLGTIDVSAGSNSRATLGVLFGAGTATRAALAERLRTPSGRRTHSRPSS